MSALSLLLLGALAVVSPGGAPDSIARSPSLLEPYDVAGVVDELLGAPLGSPWTDWLKSEAPIFMGPAEVYVGPSPYLAVDGFEQEWLYRYRWGFASGSTDWYAYALGPEARPTLERLHTEIRWREGWSSDRFWDLYRAFRDTLTARLGPGTPLATVSYRDAFGPAYYRGSIRFETRRGAIRLSIGDVWAEDGHEHPTVVLEDYSKGLLHAVSTASALESSEPMGRTIATASVAAKLSPWLPPRWSELAAALSSGATAEVKLRALRASVTSLGTGRADSAERDGVLLGLDVLVGSLSPTMQPELAELRPAFERRGVPLVFSLSEEGDSVYAHSVAMALALQSQRSRWADEAFLLAQRLGWELAFADSLPDTFEPVIARGERFLLDRRDSAVWLDVAWTVARAHETAWSLDKAEPGKEYAEGAPRHRERALQLYRAILKLTTDPASALRLKRRIQRIELDVDTGCREYAAPEVC